MPQPAIHIAIRDKKVPPAGRLPGERVHELFEHADRLVAGACRDPLIWVDAWGEQTPIHLGKDLVRVEYAPCPDGVDLTISIVQGQLPGVRPQARKAVAKLKRLWINRMKIILARALGVDIEEVDRRHEQQFAEQLGMAMSTVVLDCLGKRLACALQQANQPLPAGPTSLAG